jgi:methylmalonyl-CoA mutase
MAATRCGRNRHDAGAAPVFPAVRPRGADDILVVLSGVVPPRDYAFLQEAGVAAIFGRGTDIPMAAAEILRLIEKKRVAAQRARPQAL